MLNTDLEVCKAKKGINNPCSVIRAMMLVLTLLLVLSKRAVAPAEKRLSFQQTGMLGVCTLLTKFPLLESDSSICVLITLTRKNTVEQQMKMPKLLRSGCYFASTLVIMSKKCVSPGT
ncbi:hypothetical protein BTVI_08384 [Pitangus sulphuratus]|nr:hypothetical protein BTVI_08384 [Pitangus sulphuratus]